MNVVVVGYKELSAANFATSLNGELLSIGHPNGHANCLSGTNKWNKLFSINFAIVMQLNEWNSTEFPVCVCVCVM